MSGDDIEYNADQRKAAEYIVELTGIGGGTDPVGWLILQHRWLRERLAEVDKLCWLMAKEDTWFGNKDDIAAQRGAVVRHETRERAKKLAGGGSGC